MAFVYAALLGLVAYAVFRILRDAGGDDDGPGGPREMRISARDYKHQTRGRR